MFQSFTKQLQNHSFHFLLIPIIFILHIVNNYWNLIPAHLYLKYLFIYLLFAAFLFLIIKLILKKNRPAALLTSFSLLIFFGFGAFHDFIKSLAVPRFFTSYTLLLPLFVLLFAFLLWKFKRKKAGHEKLNYFLNTLFTLLFLFESVSFFYNLAGQKQKTNDLANRVHTLTADFKTCDTCAKPDIYFIVWDGYTSSESLLENFNFDNNNMDSFLTGHRFYISEKSKSNYRITPFSIASTLNLNYLDDKDRINKEASPKMMLQAIETVKSNDLTSFLQKEGYEIKNYSVFDLNSFPSETTVFFKNYIEHFLYDETLAGRIKRDILWNIGKIFPLKLNEVQNRLYKNFVEQGMDKLLNIISSKKEKPLFVYTHIMIPHEPFFLDEKGSFVPDSAVYSTHSMKQAYVKQLIYTNTLLKKITNSLLADSSRRKIIIMEGDHGFRNYSPEEEGQKPFENLNCYYFFDRNYTHLYNGISPVNTFRIVLNQYFSQHLPILPDSSIKIRELPGY